MKTKSFRRNFSLLPWDLTTEAGRRDEMSRLSDKARILELANPHTNYLEHIYYESLQSAREKMKNEFLENYREQNHRTAGGRP